MLTARYRGSQESFSLSLDYRALQRKRGGSELELTSRPLRTSLTNSVASVERMARCGTAKKALVAIRHELLRGPTVEAQR